MSDVVSAPPHVNPSPGDEAELAPDANITASVQERTIDLDVVARIEADLDAVSRAIELLDTDGPDAVEHLDLLTRDGQPE